MKLITEVSTDFQTVIEEANGKKRMFIEGVFLQGGVPNRNKRFYPADMLAAKVEKYNADFVAKNRAYGELGHPSSPTVNGERICMRTTSLRQEGNDFIGKAQISSTPYGQIVEGLISDGGVMGVSSRGLGSVKSIKNGISEVQSDFLLAAIDVVTDPSAPNAFVNGIMEGAEWIWDENKGWVEQVEQVQEQVKTMTQKQLDENSLVLFNRFLKNL